LKIPRAEHADSQITAGLAVIQLAFPDEALREFDAVMLNAKGSAQPFTLRCNRKIADITSALLPLPVRLLLG
jgi:hypothetical protein